MKRKISPIRLTLLGKLYTWSVVFEPLLWFIVQSGNTTLGVGGNWSRFLQALVIFGICLRLLVKHSIWKIKPFDPLYKGYTYFFLFAILSAVFGLLSGAYGEREYFVGDKFSGFAGVLLSNEVRPVFEYFIAIYYFVYFVILPRFLLSSSEGINYFFKTFFLVFYISFLIGVMDLLLIYIFGIDGLSRHIGENKYPGFRFKGLAGEPREALIYLALGLAMLALRNIWMDKRKLDKSKIILIFTAAILTQSASGIFGAVFAVILLIIFFIPKIPFKAIVSATLLIILVAFVVTMLGKNSYRIMLYFDAFGELYDVLESGNKVDSVLFVVMNNIYPIWERWRQVLEFNFLPLIIGTGLGSASAIINHYYQLNEYMNPNSSIVRLTYEHGLIGLYLFIHAFLRPIKQLGFEKKYYVSLTGYMLMLLGVYFGHRSAVPFIFLGIVIIVLQNKRKILEARV